MFREILHTFKDGRLGKKVIWYKEDYESVRDGGSNHSGAHPEVETNFKVVKQAIENPFLVRKDKDYKNRYCYYAYFPGMREYPNQHMKAILKQTLRGILIVVSAYVLVSIDDDQEVLWENTQK